MFKSLEKKWMCLSSILGLLASPSVFAYGGWTAIVFNPRTNALGSYHGANTRSEAEAGAMAFCGRDCAGVSPADLESGRSALKETFALNGWVALATDNLGRFAASGLHDSQIDAENLALRNCADSNCYIVRSLSSFQNQEDINGSNNIAMLPQRPVNPLPPPPPPPSAPPQYCAAACISSSGAPDLRYSKGASGQFLAEAQQNAISAAESAFSCNYGVVVVGCAPEARGNIFDSAAACISSSGSADLRYVADGQGQSLVEAQTNARLKVQSQYSCDFGIADVDKSEGLAASYCSAACVDSSGNPDLRYSKGGSGRNEAEARVNALIDAQNSFNCNLNVVIVSCSAARPVLR